MKADKPFPLPQHLLWEFDLDTVDYDKHYRIIIERIIERGSMEDWINAQAYYGKERFLEVAEWSKSLSDRNRSFTQLFVNSPLVQK